MPFFLASDNLKKFFNDINFKTIIIREKFLEFYTKIGIEKTTLEGIDSKLNNICVADNTIKLKLE